MPALPAATFVAPPGKQAAVKDLLKVPFIPPAVFITFLLQFVGPIVVDWYALQGGLTLWNAMLLNTFCMYWSFTVLHDSIHRSAARNQKLNDWIGRIAILAVFPHVEMGVFRWAHVQHHRFTNGSRDPDNWLHGPLWQMPLRFLLIDVGYLLYIARKGDAVARRHLRNTCVMAALTVGAVVWLTLAGYGMEVLMLWFIPSRIVLVLVGFVFFWLPHVKNDVPAEQDVTLATSVRIGQEWLFNTLFQFHNYHLIHHLYPGMPSNRHYKAWKLLEPELMKRNLQVQHNFAIRPVVHSAR